MNCGIVGSFTDTRHLEDAPGSQLYLNFIWVPIFLIAARPGCMYVLAAMFNITPQKKKNTPIPKAERKNKTQEIGDIDLSQIDPNAARERVKCPRCEKEVLEEHLQSHMTAHSSVSRLLLVLMWDFHGFSKQL